MTPLEKLREINAANLAAGQPAIVEIPADHVPAKYQAMNDHDLAETLMAMTAADDENVVYALDEVCHRAGVDLDDSELGLTKTGSATITAWVMTAYREQS